MQPGSIYIITGVYGQYRKHTTHTVGFYCYLEVLNKNCTVILGLTSIVNTCMYTCCTDSAKSCTTHNGDFIAGRKDNPKQQFVCAITIADTRKNVWPTKVVSELIIHSYNKVMLVFKHSKTTTITAIITRISCPPSNTTVYNSAQQLVGERGGL